MKVDVVNAENKKVGTLELSDEHRPAFLRDVQVAIADLAERYAATGTAAPFRIAFVCHPTTGEEDDD